MKGYSKIAALAALAWSTLTTAQDLIERGQGGNPNSCACYTATTSTTQTNCPTFTSRCIVPLCLHLTTTTIPGPNKRCRRTPTVTTPIPCQTACPQGCATYTSTVTAKSSCLKTTSTPKPTHTPTTPPPPTSTVYGKEGDRCLAFTWPPEPLCGPGLTCILDDPQVPDIGGVCKPTPPTATPTLGVDGSPCGRFLPPPQGDPPCGPGLTCVLTDPMLPDAGGFCRPSATPTPTVGAEGDKCNRFREPLDPPCGPGLVCVLLDERIPDMGGVCTRVEGCAA